VDWWDVEPAVERRAAVAAVAALPAVAEQAAERPDAVVAQRDAAAAQQDAARSCRSTMESKLDCPSRERNARDALRGP
jgi:hypothetical protein